uniref:Uncharacterized protein n=1 Tax=Solanum lycopersicum TaxID=4081 RepID=A0A3Q7IZ74_SOLLC
MNQSGKKITVATARPHTRKSKNNICSSREQVESSQVRRFAAQQRVRVKRGKDVSKALDSRHIQGSYLLEHIEIKNLTEDP